MNLIPWEKQTIIKILPKLQQNAPHFLFKEISSLRYVLNFSNVLFFTEIVGIFLEIVVIFI